MIPATLQALQSVNDPSLIVIIVSVYAVGYYVVSFFFHQYARQPNYSGAWSKGGPIDIITSFLWLLVAVVFVLSLLDLVIRNALPSLTCWRITCCGYFCLHSCTTSLSGTGLDSSWV